MGEHDDSMVPIFSNAKCDGNLISELLSLEQKQKITANVRNYWKSLREYKGLSVFGIAKTTFDITKSIIKNESLDVSASVLLDGQYGLSDVCVGVPLTIDKDGVRKIRQIEVSQDEQELLHKSADVVKSNIAKLEISR